MSNDINDLDPNDEGLKGIFGARFHDATQPMVEKTPEEKKERKVLDKSVDAQWEPVKPAANYMDKLKATVKDVFLYAFLTLVLFWWQQTGRLEITTSWYALLVCVGMVFFSVGKNIRG